MSKKGYLDMPTPAQIEAVRGHFLVKGYKYKSIPKKPLRILNPEEMQKVAMNRERVHALGKDAVDFVAELHNCGLIDGWRSVVNVEIVKEGNEHVTD